MSVEVSAHTSGIRSPGIRSPVGSGRILVPNGANTPRMRPPAINLLQLPAASVPSCPMSPRRSPRQIQPDRHWIKAPPPARQTQPPSAVVCTTTTIRKTQPVAQAVAVSYIPQSREASSTPRKHCGATATGEAPWQAALEKDRSLWSSAIEELRLQQLQALDSLKEKLDARIDNMVGITLSTRTDARQAGAESQAHSEVESKLVDIERQLEEHLGRLAMLDTFVGKVNVQVQSGRAQFSAMSKDMKQEVDRACKKELGRAQTALEDRIRQMEDRIASLDCKRAAKVGDLCDQVAKACAEHDERLQYIERLICKPLGSVGLEDTVEATDGIDKENCEVLATSADRRHCGVDSSNSAPVDQQTLESSRRISQCEKLQEAHTEIAQELAQHVEGLRGQCRKNSEDIDTLKQMFGTPEDAGKVPNLGQRLVTELEATVMEPKASEGKGISDNRPCTSKDGSDQYEVSMKCEIVCLKDLQHQLAADVEEIREQQLRITSDVDLLLRHTAN